MYAVARALTAFLGVSTTLDYEPIVAEKSKYEAADSHKIEPTYVDNFINFSPEPESFSLKLSFFDYASIPVPGFIDMDNCAHYFDPQTGLTTSIECSPFSEEFPKEKFLEVMKHLSIDKNGHLDCGDYAEDPSLKNIFIFSNCVTKQEEPSLTADR
jgi:hypothetical protein